MIAIQDIAEITSFYLMAEEGEPMPSSMQRRYAHLACAGRSVEQLQQGSTRRVRRVHGPQQSHRREPTALIDPDPERFLLADNELDPATTLRNDAARIGPAFTRLFGLHKVDAGRTMQLRNNDAL